MIIINGSTNQALARDLSNALGCELVDADISRFKDNELKVKIATAVTNEEVVVVQSICRPANDTLMELLLILDSLKRAGAKTITALIPYFGYSRQDTSNSEVSPISARLVAKLLHTAGVDKVVTLDLHSKQMEGFFDFPVANLDPSPLISKYFKGTANLTVVSPDIGGLARAKRIANILNADIAVVNKSRLAPNQCIATHVIGNVKGQQCLIIDDIIDTGETISMAAELLLEEGAVTVDVYASHAVFSDYAEHRMLKTNINNIFVSESIPLDVTSDRIKILSLQELFLSALAK